MISNLYYNSNSDINLNKVNIEETKDRRIKGIVLVNKRLIFNGQDIDIKELVHFTYFNTNILLLLYFSYFITIH